MTLRAPTATELAQMIRVLPDGPERARLENWYWAKVAEKHGFKRARWCRDEYEWLRRQWREEAQGRCAS